MIDDGSSIVQCTSIRALSHFSHQWTVSKSGQGRLPSLSLLHFTAFVSMSTSKEYMCVCSLCLWKIPQRNKNDQVWLSFAVSVTLFMTHFLKSCKWCYREKELTMKYKFKTHWKGKSCNQHRNAFRYECDSTQRGSHPRNLPTCQWISHEEETTGVQIFATFKVVCLLRVKSRNDEPILMRPEIGCKRCRLLCAGTPITGTYMYECVKKQGGNFVMRIMNCRWTRSADQASTKSPSLLFDYTYNIFNIRQSSSLPFGECITDFSVDSLERILPTCELCSKRTTHTTFSS